MMPSRSIKLGICQKLDFTVSVYSGNGDRFARIFMRTWLRLPESIRSKILEYWSTENTPTVLIELSNLWKNHKTRLAEVGFLGYEVKFNATEFDRMNDSVAQCSIAHELGHVYQHAMGLITGTSEDEDGVITFLNDWGFGAEWLEEAQWKAQNFPPN